MIKPIKYGLAATALTVTSCGGYTNVDQTPEQIAIRDAMDACVYENSPAVAEYPGVNQADVDQIVTIGCAGILACEASGIELAEKVSSQRVLMDLSKTNSVLRETAISAIPEVDDLSTQYGFGKCQEINVTKFDGNPNVTTTELEAQLPTIFNPDSSTPYILKQQEKQQG